MSDQSGVTILPEHIRKSLAKYSNHRNVTCYSCGYVGVAGVKGTYMPKASDIPIGTRVILWTIVFFITAISVIFLTGLVGIIVISITVGLAFALPRIANMVVTLECPNCSNDINK